MLGMVIYLSECEMEYNILMLLIFFFQVSPFLLALSGNSRELELDQASPTGEKLLLT